MPPNLSQSSKASKYTRTHIDKAHTHTHTAILLAKEATTQLRKENSQLKAKHCCKKY